MKGFNDVDFSSNRNLLSRRIRGVDRGKGRKTEEKEGQGKRRRSKSE